MSLRKAVDSYCKSCTYDKCVKGSWRQQVADCTAKSCDLWAHRPLPIGVKREKVKAEKVKVVS